MTTPNALYTSSPIDAADRAAARIIAMRASGVSGGILAQQIADLFNGTKGSDIASATTTNLGTATGVYVHITGTTTITSLGTSVSGNPLRWVVFDGSLTLTHNATSLILPTGSNIVTSAGDSALFVHEGSDNWRCLNYYRKNGQPLSSHVTAVSSSAGVLNLDLSLGDYFTITLTENVTSLTFSNLPPSGSGRTIMLQITQHASSPKSFTFPSSLKWSGGAGTISSTNGAIDVLAITSFDQGTTWRSTLTKNFV